jgi:hypothetical protein
LDVSDAPPTNPLEFPRNAVVELFDAVVVAVAVVSLSDSVVRICRLAEDLTAAAAAAAVASLTCCCCCTAMVVALLTISCSCSMSSSSDSSLSSSSDFKGLSQRRPDGGVGDHFSASGSAQNSHF